MVDHLTAVALFPGMGVDNTIWLHSISILPDPILRDMVKALDTLHSFDTLSRRMKDAFEDEDLNRMSGLSKPITIRIPDTSFIETDIRCWLKSLSSLASQVQRQLGESSLEGNGLSTSESD